MKKINLVLLSMMMLVLAQCTKPESEPDPVKASMKGELSMGDGSKAEIIPGSGEIRWKPGDLVYFYQPELGLASLEVNSVTGYGNNHRGAAEGFVYVSKIEDGSNGSYVLPEYLKRDLYYVGKSSQGLNGTVLQMDIQQQTGKEENVGDYLIMRAENIDFKQNHDYYVGDYLLNNANFAPRNSIALFNLEGYEDKNVTVEFEMNGVNGYATLPIYNEFKMNIPSDATPENWFDNLGMGHSAFIDLPERYNSTSNKITITNPSDRTYLVFNTLMNNNVNTYQSELRMVFKCEGEVIGTVLFPNGLKFGRYYTSVNFSPINLTTDGSGAKSLIEEHELF